MSVVSVPVTISVVGSAKAKSLFDPLNQEVSKIKNLVTNSMNGLDSKLEDEYSKFGNKVKDDYEEYLEKNLETLQGIVPMAEKSQEFLKEYGEDINYYAFELGAIAREVVKTVPTIIKDSALEAMSGGQNQNLLSAQKIMDIAKNSNITSFMSGVLQAMTQHKSLLYAISAKDAQGVIQIFKELPRTEIDSFLSGVQTNASNLDKNSSNYCSPTKLILHLLIGKEKIEGITTQINQLEQQLETMKETLKGIEGIDDSAIDSLKTQLKSISEKQTIKDPCAQESK